MEFGLVIFPTDETISPIELVVAAETHGFEFLWFPEHSHIPISRETPWGGVKGMPELPEEYKRTLDQFVKLAACASVGLRIKLGPGITLVAQRDPGWLAKEVASLDYLSGGGSCLESVMVGIVKCCASTGLLFRTDAQSCARRSSSSRRFGPNRKQVFTAITSILRRAGRGQNPFRSPPPSIMGAAAGPKNYADIVEFFDGWMPVGGLHDFEGCLLGLREACVTARRDPDSLELTLFLSLGFEPANLSAYAKAGVKRIVLPLPSKSASIVLPLLVNYARYLPA